MIFDNQWADPKTLEFLNDSIIEKRISHAQLFVGKPGWGTFSTAMAYARYVLCEGKEACNQRVDHFNHPDLHFSIPTFKLDKSEAITKNYIGSFKEMMKENPYADLNDWYDTLDAGNKQGFLSKNEIEEVIKSLSLKSFEGGYKVLIIWNADKMKVEYANKFLKFLEEPPEKTLFLLLAESKENMLETITSRCVEVEFKPIKEERVQQFLQEKFEIPTQEAQKIAELSEGDLQLAIKSVNRNVHKELFEQEFAEWTRNSFQLKDPKKLHLLQNILQQAERIASWNTEQQKLYLQFCMDTFRQALFLNYQTPTLVHSPISSNNFKFDIFAQKIHGANITEIIEELNNTYFFVERNANKKLAFTNLGIKLSRYIHKNYN